MQVIHYLNKQLKLYTFIVLVNLMEAGFIELTPIQMQVIPAVISGRDLLVSSATGSGKCTYGVITY